MRLEIHRVKVDKVVFGSTTSLEKGTLHINREELLLLIADPRFASMQIDLASPGDNCRITRVADIIEPRLKLDDEEATFPGALGKLRRAGSGRTIALQGVNVVETWQVLLPISQTIIDMSGPGAAYSPFSKTFNVIITATAAEGIDKFEYASALKKASLTVATYLARAARNCKPDEVEVFDLGKEYLGDRIGNLPRVVYIYQLFAHKPLGETLLYGDHCRQLLPMVIHPNEILDCALINNNYEHLNVADVTYTIQNHPIVRELYRRHGVDLDFAGVVLTNAPPSLIEKEKLALLTATQVKYVLAADGAIITKEGGGHPQIDVVLNCERCEELGVKTVIVVSEMMTTSRRSDETLIFNSPKADAIVSTGCFEFLDLPAVERLIGGPTIPDLPVHLAERLAASTHVVRGASSHLGYSWITSQEY